MKPRLHPYVSQDNYDRVRAMAARPNETESSVVDRALSFYFVGRHDDLRDAAILRRLDRLTSQFSRLERNDLILTESNALFVRYFMTMTQPVPPSQMDAARAQGAARLERFVESLAQGLRAGRRLLQGAVDEVMAEEKDFFSEDDFVGAFVPGPEREAEDA